MVVKYESNYSSWGHSKRFGSPKAFAIHGEMFYKRIINTLTETNLFDDIIIVQTNNLRMNLSINILW